ncbi:MAG: tyrosine-type recombinase/integrase [Akkermansia sp.]
MKGIKQRGAKWSSNWKLNGKTVSYGIGLYVKGTANMTPSNSRKAAESISEAWKNAAHGHTTRKQAEDAIKAIPNLPPKVANDAIDRVKALAVADSLGNMPSIRYYLTNYKGDASPKAEEQRASIYAKFIKDLGANADRRLDSLSPDTCRAWLRIELARVAVATVSRYQSLLSAAFNRAAKDAIIDRNPFSNIELVKMASSVNGAMKDKTEKEPFTPEEMNVLCTRIAQPWRDMVILSLFTGGQRLGDVACFKWESVNWDTGILTFTTTKTRHAIECPITPPLHHCLSELWQNRLDEVYVFPDMARRYERASGSLSTEFIGILNALGITGKKRTEPLKGERRNVAAKSFHSIRHYVVTGLRSSNQVSADVSRAIVGHDSEQIERAYFTASSEVKIKGLQLLAEQIGL